MNNEDFTQNVKNYKLPKVSFGAATLGDEYGKVDKNEGIKAVKRALELGINFFDTSPYYGRKKSEEALGVALKEASESLGLKRSDYFICTKVGRFDVSEFFKFFLNFSKI
jgi:L-galactose dehydrogenase